MIINRIYNNNIILVRDENNIENILLGKGIAFGKKVGEKADPEQVEKRFILGQDSNVQKFIESMNQIPASYLELTSRIIANAEKELNTTFRSETYIALTDHINFAIEKMKRNIETKNLLLWEIKRFYKKEFETAKHSLKIIEKYEGISLPEDEAGYLAIHFVNAQYDSDKNEDIATMTKMINDIVKIIEYNFSIKIDDGSLSFERFITHVRFFAQRVFSNKLLESKDNEYYIHLKKKYPDIVRCVDKIDKYIKEEYKRGLTDDEYMYFIMHIGRLITK